MNFNAMTDSIDEPKNIMMKYFTNFRMFFFIVIILKMTPVTLYVAGGVFV